MKYIINQIVGTKVLNISNYLFYDGTVDRALNPRSV